MQTGQIIRSLREKSGMSQDELAEKLFVSRYLVSKWENGERRPRLEYIGKLSELFSVPAEEIADTGLVSELSDCVPGDADMSESEIAEAVNSFLSELPRKERSLFIMRYYYLKEIPELCDGFGMKPNAVYTSLSRTKNKLRDYLRRNCHE